MNAFQVNLMREVDAALRVLARSDLQLESGSYCFEPTEAAIEERVSQMVESLEGEESLS